MLTILLGYSYHFIKIVFSFKASYRKIQQKLKGNVKFFSQNILLIYSGLSFFPKVQVCRTSCFKETRYGQARFFQVLLAVCSWQSLVTMTSKSTH